MSLKAGQTVTINEWAGEPRTVELWDRAPLYTAPRGYCDPWWVREADGWYVVARTRGPGPVWHAWDVSEDVARGMATLAAMPAANDSREAVGGGWGTSRYGVQSVRREWVRVGR